MSLVLKASHSILNLACKKAFQDYKTYATQLEFVQREKLKALLGDSSLSYEQFTKNYPLTRYADWKDKIEKSRKTSKNFLRKEPIIRFQPTSGSSEALKFIPYTKSFLDELDQAIGLWLCSLYERNPSLKDTTHYWSVSWLPESQRNLVENKNLNDDSALLNFSKRVLTQLTQAVPSEIALAKTAEDAMFATAVYLVADQNLGMISVWSPTFALQLLELIEKHKHEISQGLITGQWEKESLTFIKAPKSQKQGQKLVKLDFSNPDVWKKIWPKLCLISSWDTASAQHWAAELKKKIGVAGITFEGKGLWATEAVVTVPFENQYPLMYQSHFYEFLIADTEEVLPSWALKKGDIVSPVISTGSGLLRYVIDDELEVTGFYQSVPCFKFLGRKMTVDMVGEKLDHQVALHVLAQLKQEDYSPMCLLGIEYSEHKKPYYALLSEGDASKQPSPELLDEYLRRNFHYELARNLGQLDQPEVIHVEDSWDYYKNLAMSNGMIEGNIKPEPLKKFKTIRN